MYALRCAALAAAVLALASPKSQVLPECPSLLCLRGGSCFRQTKASVSTTRVQFAAEAQFPAVPTVRFIIDKALSVASINPTHHRRIIWAEDVPFTTARGPPVCAQGRRGGTYAFVCERMCVRRASRAGKKSAPRQEHLALASFLAFAARGRAGPGRRVGWRARRQRALPRPVKSQRRRRYCPRPISPSLSSLALSISVFSRSINPHSRHA